MKNQTTIAAIVIAAIALFVAPAAADTITSPSVGGGGGTSSPAFVMPPIELEASMDYSFYGGYVRASSEYLPEENETTCYGGADLNQGYGNNYYPLGVDFGINRRNDYGSLYVEYSLYCLKTPEDYPSDWTDLPDGQMDFKSNDFCIDLQFEVRKSTRGYWDDELYEWVEIESNNIDSYFRGFFKNFICEDFDIDIEEETEEWNNYDYTVFEIEIDFELQYNGPVEGLTVINNQFALVPEPASVSIIGLGALALIRRRK